MRDHSRVGGGGGGVAEGEILYEGPAAGEKSSMGGGGGGASQREKSSMRDRSRVLDRSLLGLLRSSSLRAQLKSPPTTTGIVQCSRGASLVRRETPSATL